MKKGILKITSIEDFEMRFESSDGTLNQGFCSSKEDFRKWFCSSSLERAEQGVPASYDGKNNLMTEEWDLKRRASFLGQGDYQLSHHFC